jgi:hypothetical protein
MNFFCYLRLEPLLARIKEKPTTVVCPLINSINAKTFKYSGIRLNTKYLNTKYV